MKLRFWTNNISVEPGKTRPKSALSPGVVRIKGNKAHEVMLSGSRLLHSLLDMGAVIDKVLIENDTVLHTSRKMRK